MIQEYYVINPSANFKYCFHIFLWNSNLILAGGRGFFYGGGGGEIFGPRVGAEYFFKPSKGVDFFQASLEYIFNKCYKKTVFVKNNWILGTYKIWTSGWWGFFYTLETRLNFLCMWEGVSNFCLVADQILANTPVLNGCSLSCSWYLKHLSDLQHGKYTKMFTIILLLNLSMVSVWSGQTTILFIHFEKYNQNTIFHKWTSSNFVFLKWILKTGKRNQTRFVFFVFSYWFVSAGLVFTFLLHILSNLFLIMWTSNTGSHMYFIPSSMFCVL